MQCLFVWSIFVVVIIFFGAGRGARWGKGRGPALRSFKIIRAPITDRVSILEDSTAPCYVDGRNRKLTHGDVLDVTLLFCVVETSIARKRDKLVAHALQA